MRTFNRNFRTIHRLVIDPRYRGAGIAADFLAECCARMPQPWIELVSVMAGIVPFAERAGFKLIGYSKDKIKEQAISTSTWHQRKECRRHGIAGSSIKEDRSAERPAYYVLDNKENKRKRARP